MTGRIGVAIGLAVALCGALGLLSGYVPRMYAGLIVIVAIGIIVGTQKTALPNPGR